MSEERVFLFSGKDS